MIIFSNQVSLISDSSVLVSIAIAAAFILFVLIAKIPLKSDRFWYGVVALLIYSWFLLFPNVFLKLTSINQLFLENNLIVARTPLGVKIFSEKLADLTIYCAKTDEDTKFGHSSGAVFKFENSNLHFIQKINCNSSSILMKKELFLTSDNIQVTKWLEENMNRNRLIFYFGVFILVASMFIVNRYEKSLNSL